jgi:hypothetical protein
MHRFVLGTYYVRTYSLDLPQESYIGTFALSGGGLGGDVTGTSVRIALSVFVLTYLMSYGTMYTA